MVGDKSRCTPIPATRKPLLEQKKDLNGQKDLGKICQQKVCLALVDWTLNLLRLLRRHLVKDFASCPSRFHHRSMNSVRESLVTLGELDANTPGMTSYLNSPSNQEISQVWAGDSRFKGSECTCEVPPLNTEP